MKPNQILAIDPGTGIAFAIATQQNNGWHVEKTGQIKEMVIRTKAGKRGKTRKILNAWKVRDLLENLSKSAEIHVVCENIQPMPGRGVVSTASFLKAVGILEGLCIAFRISFTSIPPAVWKRKLKLGKDKGQSLLMAKKLFPRTAGKIEDHNVAEACLLLYYYVTFVLEQKLHG